MSRDVAINYLEPLALFDVKGDPIQLERVMNEVNLDFPDTPHSLTFADSVLVFRAGRQRCFVIADLQLESELSRKFATITSGILVQCTCVSDLYQGFSIVGEKVERALSQITSLNLSEFEAHTATFTELFRLSGFIIFDAKTQYRFFVDRSYSDYMVQRLKKCEFVEISFDERENG